MIQTSFFDDFESYTAGQQLVVQNPVDWTTWSGTPGTGEDPNVSDAYASSGSNSVVIVENNDLVKPLGQLTSGSWEITFDIYIPNGKAGYFNTMSGFTPNPFQWAMECYFNVGGNGQLSNVPGGPVNFTYAYDTWQEVKLVIDLNNDQAQFSFDGVLYHDWQWTQGGSVNLQLDANDFFGATPNDEMYFDDYSWGPGVISGIGDGGDTEIPDEFALYQNYPNPFNPTTTIKYALKADSDVELVIYNMLGQKVKTLVSTRQTAGYKTIQWDGTNDNGTRVASGIYIYRIKAGNEFVKARKMLFMK
jgi:hypothetical protein